MDKESLIKKVRALSNRKDLFNLLNEIKAELSDDLVYPFTRKQFLTLCNPKNSKDRYTYFYIPKKSGGERQICAPTGNLKWFQLCLNEIFKVLYVPSPYAMGFTPGRSIIDNAQMHTNQNYVFNIDLKDFFPSIDQARVWKRLQLEPFNFTPKIAGIIAGFCSIKTLRLVDDKTAKEFYVLPQGAPTSPLLTNAICDTLDRRLHGLAKRFGLHYSRYADDITFSSMHNVYQPDSAFRKELERIISEQHFTINSTKTRLAHCSARQEVTGLTVGQKINVTRRYVKDLRAILHIWEKYGLNAAYATFYPRYKSEKCQLQNGDPNLENVIFGKLCYLKMVKGEKDPVYLKLFSQFSRLIVNSGVSQEKQKIDYLFTLSKSDFEHKLGVRIQFKERVKDKKTYGYFYYHDRFFVVAISKNLDINNLPDNLQISLTRMETSEEANLVSGQMLSNPSPTTTRIGYLLHKPLRGFRSGSNNTDNTSMISDELRSMVINFANTFPELELNDDIGILQTHNDENLLNRLIQSDFDLSILP